MGREVRGQLLDCSQLAISRLLARELPRPHSFRGGSGSILRGELQLGDRYARRMGIIRPQQRSSPEAGLLQYGRLPLKLTPFRLATWFVAHEAFGDIDRDAEVADGL